MKKTISIALAILLCIVFFLPITSHAKTYSLGGTDMEISVDDTAWYVFTRDNIKNNSELAELGLSYDYVYNILYNNNAYLDALFLYSDGEYVEFFVRKKALDDSIANLSNYENSEVLEFAKELAKKQEATNYSVYENQYKFAKMEYLDSQYGFYICEYVTVVNKDNYTLTFQATSPFTADEYAEIEKIVNSIKFDVDTSIKEPEKTSAFNLVIERAISGAVIGGSIGLIVALISKKKKKNNKHNNTDFINGPTPD